AVGAIVLVAGGAAAGYALTHKTEAGGMTPQSAQAMDAAIAGLDADIKAARAAVHERATTFAEVPAVQAAIATDKETAHDMVERGELKFQTQPGEVIAIVQVPKGKPGVALVVLPDNATNHRWEPPESTGPGVATSIINDQIMIDDTAPIAPKERANELGGYVIVVRHLTLDAAIDRLAAAGVTGRFEIGNKIRTIGAPVTGATEMVKPLPSLPRVKLVVAVPPMQQASSQMPLVAGGGAAAVLGLVLVIVGLAGGKRAAAARQPEPQPIGTAPTQMSTPGIAGGTPSPVGAGDSMSIHAKPIEAGQMIGRWEVVRRLGSGGMADVYLARARGEAGFEKLVAIKVMHPHLARNSRAVDHFLDEARLAARITHPNVVQIQDLGKIGEDYVIVMEYVDGVDLERLLTAAREAGRLVPVDVALGILCRICDGLNAAHKATAPDGTPLHVIHRDVKAANVLVSRQGGVKVVDFGIAKAAKQGHMTVAGETKGTPSMMAPEQRIGEQVDVRADVYAVGAVAFEILTGQGVNLDLAALAHLGTENWPHLPPPSSLRPQLPPELDALVLGAMAFERDRRPADCAAFEASFEAVMKRHALTASDKDIARWVTSELALLPSGSGTAATELTT
ncbi:MAG: serine/threonine-protein kinase, partial [Acidobacteriota bacterium]